MSVGVQVSAVVVAHQAGERLLSTLAGLQQAGSFAEILLVDSGSTDGSVQRAYAANPSLRVFPYDSNVGPCVTRNRGLREARSPFVLLIDDDMDLAPGLLSALLTPLLADENCVASGPRICDGVQRDVVQYEGGRWHYAGVPSFLGAGSREAPGPMRDVDVLTSGCLLVRREPVLLAGGFRSLLGYLMEDVELCLRLRLMGLRLVVVPTALAWNAGGSTGLSLRGASFPTRRLVQQARNRALVRCLIFTPTTRLLCWPGVALFELAGLAMSTASLKPHAWVWGKLSARQGRREALRLAREFRQLRKESDGTILGAPPLVFTAAARGSGATGPAARFLDGALRLWWRVIGRFIA
ncbi:MAG: glycosyltransferase family 2 protein [Planctomycetes bacterium]|nr:glycosyltransferase family 2 protein [Planctomycetota bacterium]